MYTPSVLSYSPKFSGNIKKETSKVQDSEEKMQFLTGRVCEVMADRIEKEVPENGKFSPLSVSWDVPETLNKALLRVEADALNPKDSRRLSVGAYRKGSDSVRSSYLLKGTKKEILDYVKNPENKETIIKVARQLSDSVDNHYSELY